MNKTTTWLIRGAALVVIGGGLFAFLSLGNKRTLKFSKPSVEDWKYQELDIKRQSAESAAKRELMNYRKFGNRIFCNAAMSSWMESVDYAIHMDLYILGKDADFSELKRLKKDIKRERSRCMDFNP